MNIDDNLIFDPQFVTHEDDDMNERINDKIKEFIDHANMEQEAIKNADLLVKDAMYGTVKRNLIDAYTYVVNNNQINFTYQEIKDYLFHNGDLI